MTGRRLSDSLARGALLRRLGRAWDQVPTMRLGELLILAASNDSGKALIEAGDEEAVRAVEAYAEWVAGRMGARRNESK